MRVTTFLLAGWLVIPMVGCANLHDVRYELSQKSRTLSAWRSFPDCAKDNQNYPKDYERGWKDGFYDVTTGGTGCPPVVAPRCYWEPSQILDHCDNRRNAYYSGFQDGAAHASQFPDTHHLRPWGSCDCPLPTCQVCPEGACGCPIGACGLSSAVDAGNAVDGVAASPEAPSEQRGSLEMLESPAAGSSASSQPSSASAPVTATATPGQPTLTQSPPAAPAASNGNAMVGDAWVQTANAFGPVQNYAAPHKLGQESTVKQAAPFALPEPKGTGTVRLASEIKLPN